MLKCIEQIEENAKQLNDVNIEYLHQMRVGLRKLYIAMQLLAKLSTDITLDDKFVYFMQEVRQLETKLGIARDWDVFTQNTLPPIKAKLPLIAAHQLIQEHANKITLQQHKQIIRLTQTQNYKNLWINFKDWLKDDNSIIDKIFSNKPIMQICNTILQNKQKKLLRYPKSPATQISDQQQHKLRIFIKKFHYTLNFFAHLYPKQNVTKYLKMLKNLQGQLGVIHDYVVMRNLCNTLLKQRPASDTQYKIGIGEIIGWKACEVDFLLIKFKKQWHKLRHLKPFWNDQKLSANK